MHLFHVERFCTFKNISELLSRLFVYTFQFCDYLWNQNCLINRVNIYEIFAFISKFGKKLFYVQYIIFYWNCMYILY